MSIWCLWLLKKYCTPNCCIMSFFIFIKYECFDSACIRELYLWYSYSCDSITYTNIPLNCKLRNVCNKVIITWSIHFPKVCISIHCTQMNYPPLKFGEHNNIWRLTKDLYTYETRCLNWVKTTLIDAYPHFWMCSWSKF